MCELLTDAGLGDNILGFCDSNPDKQGTLFAGKPIYSYEQCEKHDNTIFIIAAINSAKTIFDIVNKSGRGIPVIFDFFSLYHYPDIPLLMKSWNVTTFINNWVPTKYTKEIEQARMIWEDEKSFAIYNDILQLRAGGTLLNNYNYLDPLEEQYLDEVVKFGQEEIIIDAGGFNIDTIKSVSQYLQRQGLTHKRYICIEPIQEFCKSIAEGIVELNLDNVEVINKGVYDKKSILQFSIAGVGSRIVNNSIAQTSFELAQHNIVEVETDTLDELCKDLSITFLKMDIEGAEHDY